MNATVLVTWSLALVVMIGGPLAAAIWFRRGTGAPWRAFMYGTLVFGLFQLLTRVPLIAALGPLIAPRIQASSGLLALYLAALGMSAGLVESVGRWVGYRWWFPKRLEYTWRNGVAYGLGHGGIEAVLLVGLSSASNLVQYLYLLGQTPEQLQSQIPAATIEAVLAAREHLLTVTWVDPLLAALERVLTMIVHVALSLMVLRGFQRGQRRWLWLAVLAHGLMDTSVVMLSALAKAPAWALELYLLIWAALALWLILAWRPVPIDDTTA